MTPSPAVIVRTPAAGPLPAAAGGTAEAAASALCQLQAQGLVVLVQQQGWPLAIKDAETARYEQVSPEFAALLDRGVAETIGRTDAELFDATVATALRAADQTALAQGQPLESEHKFEWGGQRQEFKVLRLALTQGGVCRVLSVWQDQAPQRQREHQLKVALDQLEQQQKANDSLRRELSDQAPRDQASGLNSRAHFDDQMRRELDLSTREHREFALVYMALDPFTPEVAAWGARAQDRICEAMGRLLRGNTRAMDASCRLDDRHFAVLLSGVGLATAHSRMEGLRRQCATQIVMLDGVELGFTVAMGVASFPHTAHSHEELIQACRKALAEAHRRGGNTVALASIQFDQR